MQTHSRVKVIIVQINCDPTIELNEALWNLVKRLKCQLTKVIVKLTFLSDR